MKKIFDFYKINLVIDVGANEGQFGRSLRDIGYQGKIISFEPLSQAHQELIKVGMQDSNWIVAPRMAIGRTTGEVSINVAANLESSSILLMSSLHSDAAPTSKYTTIETVAMNTLDNAASHYITSASVTLVKIDTQGFEAEVLAGAANILSHAIGVQLEMSLSELYEGQASYLDLIQVMSTKGFMLVELVPGFSDPRTGHLLQADGIFVKKPV
jgi:FkbM family methyltransferase